MLSAAFTSCLIKINQLVDVYSTPNTRDTASVHSYEFIINVHSLAHPPHTHARAYTDVCIRRKVKLSLQLALPLLSQVLPSLLSGLIASILPCQQTLSVLETCVQPDELLP
jgi:hypothetical protein